jgi:hypothetical protein
MRVKEFLVSLLNRMLCKNYQYSKLAPALAVIAAFAPSLAKRICRVPFAEGLIRPSMIARLPFGFELLLHPVGTLIAFA